VQASRSKNEFLANMSHELRTPLNSILGFSEALLEQRRGPLNEKQEQYINLIYSSGEHLLGLINDILDVSKVEAGKLDIHPEVISLSEVCESSLKFVREAAEKKLVSLTFRNEQSLSSLRADPRRLKQILVNLLNNAVKFTPESGAVSLEVHANAERDQIEFSVTDNGIGIASDDLPKLFKPFIQIDNSLSRYQEGSGLGLVLILKLTELHGGSVKVESEAGKGSRFTVILPWSANDILDRPQAATVEAAATFVPLSGGQGCILLVEDSESNVLTVQEYLKGHGYEVIVAHNGLEAIARAEESSPSLILMDIQMPELDGLEAIRRLRATPKFAFVPIIAVTALAMPGDRERCLDAGANEYLDKPVNLRMLLKTIGEMLEKGNGSIPDCNNP
jgi:CheY-like chemotaxis protein/anti-sigma regulatory factor (Ser/Thr protein kinase)